MPWGALVMAGPPAKTTQAELAVGAAADCDATHRDAIDQLRQTTAAIDSARVTTVHDEFLAIVRALAKRHAREDYAAEIAARSTSQPAIKVEP